MICSWELTSDSVAVKSNFPRWFFVFIKYSFGKIKLLIWTENVNIKMISYTSESGYENFLLSYSEKLLLTRLTKCPWEIIGKEKWEKIYTRRSCNAGALGNWMLFKLKLLQCTHFSLPVPWQIFIKHWINTILVWWYCENEKRLCFLVIDFVCLDCLLHGNFIIFHSVRALCSLCR